MNPLFIDMQINQLSGRLRQIAGTPNILSIPFSAVDVANFRESIITIANGCKTDEPQIARQLLAAKEILFAFNPFGQGIIIRTLSVRFFSGWIIFQPNSRNNPQKNKRLAICGFTYTH